MNPLVSIIVAVKNGEQYLGSALESIVKQDYEPREVIVIDGHSTDRTPEIAASFGFHFLKQKQTGIAAAYNMGIEESKGELIAFLSHDDLWSPDKLSCQITYMIENPELQYTVTRGKYFLQDGCSIPSRFKPDMLQGDHVIYGVESLMIRRALFDRVGKFNPEFAVGEDIDWFARARDMHVPMGVVEKVLLYKRVHDSSACMKENNVNKIFVRILKKSLDRKKSL